MARRISAYDARMWLESVKALGIKEFFFDELHKFNLGNLAFLRKCISSEYISSIDCQFRGAGHTVHKWRIEI